MYINYIRRVQSIQTLRIRRGLSQAKLAELADISTTYMSNIETGVKQVSLETLFRIAKCLGVTVSNLLGEEIDSIQQIMIWGAFKLYVNSSPFEKQLMSELLITVKKCFASQFDRSDPFLQQN